MSTRPRERKLLFGAAALAVALPAAAHWYASHRLEAGAEPALSRALGTEVEIGAVEVDLAGTLRLEEVRIGDVAEAEAIEASVSLASLAAGRARPDEIRVSGPRVRVAVDADGRTNVEHLARRVAERLSSRRHATGDERGARTAREPGHKSRLRRVIVNDGDLVVDLGQRGALRLRNVEARPREGGVRLLVGGTEVDLSGHGVRARGELGHASADIRLPELSLWRALSVGGDLAIDGRRGDATLRDVVLAHNTDGRTDSRVQARVERAGRDGRLSLRLPRSRDRLAVDAIDVPMAALSSFLPDAVRLHDASFTGRASARRTLDGHAFALEGTLRGISIFDRRVARVPVQVEGELSVAVARAGDSLSITDARVKTGAIDLTGSARFDGQGPDSTGRVTVELARAGCSDVLTSLPAAMRAHLGGMRATGTVAARADLDFSRRDERATRLDVDVDVDRCRIRNEPAAADPTRVRTAFEHRFPNGTTSMIGPDNPDYASLRSMPRYVPRAWVAAEDAAFFSHNGFDVRQIERSLAVDLRAGAFVRGGSTISQQLVKNVFLSHERTLARKLQEAVLTWRLESRVDKKLILERYLNIIELGPGVYGVPAAARYWFGKRTRDLSVAETAFLVALTPEPGSATKRIRAEGGLDPETAQRMRVILRHMHRRGAISDSAYERAKRRPPSLDLRLAQR